MKSADLIKKADMTLADLATAGHLSQEQSNQFIRKMIVQPTLLKQARVVTMNAPSRKINKIGFGSRIMRPATSGTALAVGDRSKPDLSKIELNTKEVIAEIRLPYDVIEDNIERGNVNFGGAGDNGSSAANGGLVNTILALIAERAALDFEELALLGDTGSGDAYLALCDGFLKRATSNVVDAGASTISKAVFKAGLKAMPDQYLRNKTAMRHYVSVDNETEYRDTIADRQTALGDATLQGTSPVYGFGVGVEGVSLMPGSQGLLTNPLNLIMGIQRQLSLEVDKIITERMFVIVLTARVDFQIEEEESVVKYTNIA
jgi:hypothetical protein